MQVRVREEEKGENDARRVFRSLFFFIFRFREGERKMLDRLRLRLFVGPPSPPRSAEPKAGTKSSCDAATQTDDELLLLLLRQQAVRRGGVFLSLV